ncbi:MAG: phenylacetate--CoA ligase family protein [Planctomycetaceae bacterium]|nr:phenylacetate--CoA ligase family protein [Planctomycetaceae bacterium]
MPDARTMHISLLNVLGYYLGGIWTTWGGRRRIEQKQLQNLRKLVATARQDSPYFRRLYKDVPDTDRLTLGDLPVTFKPWLMSGFDDWVTDRTLKLADLREHMSDLSNIGLPYGDVAVFRTSGTSGEPAVIILTAADIEYIFGITLARLSRAQLKLFPELNKSGSNVTITGASGHFAGAGLARLVRHLTRNYPSWLKLGAANAVHIAAELPIHQIVEQLNQISTVASILTYPSILTILAREKEAGRLKVDQLFIKVGGETLTQELRDQVRQVFTALQTEIMDAYACTECLLLSIECGCGRKHVPEDWVILEAVDAHLQPVPDGEQGESSLLTVLANHVQPFIRYELGDQIRFHTDPCPCGSPFRSFEVLGRLATLLRIGDVELSPLVFDLEREGAQRVQLVQIGEHEFDLRLELQPEASRDLAFSQVISSIENTLRQNGISAFTINRSQEPPRLTASGKFHEVVPLRRQPVH